MIYIYRRIYFIRYPLSWDLCYVMVIFQVSGALQSGFGISKRVLYVVSWTCSMRHIFIHVALRLTKIRQAVPNQKKVTFGHRTNNTEFSLLKTYFKQINSNSRTTHAYDPVKPDQGLFFLTIQDFFCTMGLVTVLSTSFELFATPTKRNLAINWIRRWTRRFTTLRSEYVGSFKINVVHMSGLVIS